MGYQIEGGTLLGCALSSQLMFASLWARSISEIELPKTRTLLGTNCGDIALGAHNRATGDAVATLDKLVGRTISSHNYLTLGTATIRQPRSAGSPFCAL